jgi:hypothetical protein
VSADVLNDPEVVRELLAAKREMRALWRELRDELQITRLLQVEGDEAQLATSRAVARDVLRRIGEKAASTERRFMELDLVNHPSLEIAKNAAKSIEELRLAQLNALALQEDPFKDLPMTDSEDNSK